MNFLKRLIALGTDDIKDYRLFRVIMLINVICVGSLVLTLIFSVFYLTIFKIRLFLTTLPPIFVMGLVLWLNSRKMFVSSRFILLILSHFCILFAVYFLGAKTSIHFFLIASFAVGGLICQKSEWISQTIFFLLPAGLFLWIFTCPEVFQGVVTVPIAIIDILGVMTISTSFLMVGGSIFAIGNIIEVVQTHLIKHEEQNIHAAKLYSLGIMSAGVAHEINNPLSIIKGNAELLKTEFKGNSELIEKRFEAINKNVNRISKIVQGLRTLSRESSEDTLERHSLKSIVEESLNLCTQVIEVNNGIKIDTAALTEDCLILCKPSEIMQVIINLVNNAMDAVASNNDRWIKLEMLCSGKTVDLRVIDSGEGIDPKLAERIMQPFFTTKEVGKGTGLGLSISQTIVENHKGKLFVDSNCPNTCFVVRLPRIV